MSYDIDEVTESKWEKPVKRVRFSDEVKDVHEYDREYDSEIFSNETDISTSSLIPVLDEQNKGFVEELNKINEKGTHYDTSVFNADKNSSDGGVNTIPMSESTNTVNDSGTVEFFTSDTNNSDSDKCDLNELINGTGLMSISEPDRGEKDSDFASSEMHSLFISSSEANSPKNIFQITAQSAKKDSISSLPRKRSLEGKLIEKQTSKLSSCLSKNTANINSADELKNAVFEAWNEVKCKVIYETIPFQPTACATTKESSDNSKGTSSHDAYEKWWESKRKMKTVKYKISKPVYQKTKEDLEESKMAFEAWKKKKDELLKQKFAEKCKKEKEERLALLMNEKIKKSDAESAYSAWNAHKILAIKMDKRRKQWLVEKEREKLNEKMKKNEEAAKVYYEWLRNKVYSRRSNAHKSDADRPCWTPPGKANSIM